MTVTYEGRPFVLVRKAAVFHPSRVRQLPCLTEADLLARFQRRPDCVPAKKRRVTDPGYHKGCIPANKGRRYPATPLTPDEALRVLEQFRTSPCGRRSRALFVLLWRSGLRISEALALLPEDIDWAQSAIFVRCGKGGKSRYSGIDQFGLGELRAWMDYRARRGHTDEQPIFCILEGPSKGGRLGSPSFRQTLKEAADWAGIRKRVAPHQLRHAHACDLAREGVLLPHIQRQLGHANPGITGTYLSGLPTAEAVAAVAARPSPLALTSSTAQEKGGPLEAGGTGAAVDAPASSLRRDHSIEEEER